jgi:hypothetical protein
MEDYIDEKRQDLGYVPSDKVTNKKIRALLRDNSTEGGALEKALKIVSKPFPPLGPGETVLKGEYIKRFNEVKSVGYFVGPYSHLNATETEIFFLKLKKELIEKARETCPGFLRDIEEQNQQ